MSEEQLIELHSERAMSELDMAMNASCIQAAQAHYNLSQLHLDRMRNLKQSRPLADRVRGH